MKKITKTVALAYLQCVYKAWTLYHGPAKSDKNEETAKHNGRIVGKLYTLRYPGGIDASENDTLFRQEATNYTNSLMAAGTKAIFEAQFQTTEGLHLVKLDVLLTEEAHVIEVKSTTSVKDKHILECAYYEWIFRQIGYKAKKYTIAYLNKYYVRNGPLDIQQLFIEEDVTARVHKAVPLWEHYLEHIVKDLRLVRPPKPKLGSHCTVPHICERKDECHRDLSDQNSVMHLTGMLERNKYLLVERGIRNMSDVKLQTKLNARQIAQVNAHLEGKLIADIDWIREYLDGLNSERLYFLDFETYMEPIPAHDGLRPYSQVPFQYSLHILRKGMVNHLEHLGKPGTDTRRPFVEQLIRDLEKPGLIITYNMSFELSRLKELSEAFPEHRKELSAIMLRVRDLMLPFRQMKIYHPKMKGSYSLKKVLPAFIANLAYFEDGISNGAAAANAFCKMKKLPKEEQNILMKQLRDYCALDTKALVELFGFLKNLIISTSKKEML